MRPFIIAIHYSYQQLIAFHSWDIYQLLHQYFVLLTASDYYRGRTNCIKNWLVQSWSSYIPYEDWLLHSCIFTDSNVVKTSVKPYQNVVQIQQKIAREKGKLNLHFDKWKPINNLASNVNWSAMLSYFVLCTECLGNRNF